jgi:hypothetical protein
METVIPREPQGEVALRIEIRDIWWGGFRAELTITAEGEVAGWEAVLTSRWTLREAGGAVVIGREDTPEGEAITLADAGWNAVLADGESASVTLLGETGEAGLMDRAALLDGIWIG